MSGRHASRDAASPSRTRLAQVIHDERQNVIGRNKRAVTINEAESVSVAVSRNSEREPLVEHELAQFSQILFRRFGAVASEQHVSIIMNNADLATAPPQNLVQIASAGSPQRVVCEFQPGRGDLRKIDASAEAAQIILARIEIKRFSRGFSPRLSNSARLK